MTQGNLTIFLPFPTHYNFKNLTGQRFGRLIVVGLVGIERIGCMWFCQCDCGQSTTTAGTRLRNGTCLSCGCFAKESSAKTGAKSRTHGQTKTVEYHAYMMAMSRCNNPKNISYSDYGERGIEFRFKSFQEFFTELGLRPSPKHSVDRKDTNGHYEKGNVRWATPIEQANNTRSNRLVTVQGQTRTLAEWVKSDSRKRKKFYRLVKSGWCEPCAVTFQKGCGHNV